MTQLHRYLARIQDTILSRQEIEVEEIEILDRSDRPGQTSEFYARLRFYDGSQLQIVEKLITERYTIIKSRYAYHYQQADSTLIFRYDNVPHHPEVETYPHHKHIGDTITAIQPPDLGEVLYEIDGIFIQCGIKISREYLYLDVTTQVQRTFLDGCRPYQRGLSASHLSG